MPEILYETHAHLRNQQVEVFRSFYELDEESFFVIRENELIVDKETVVGTINFRKKEMIFP